MASTVNATNSGIVVTGDTSGELNLQVGGSNAIEITSDEVAVTAGGTVAAAFNSNGLFFRNRIINGDMRIDQRNAGAAVTINTTSNIYTLDRWVTSGQVTDGVFTVQRDTDTPSGFTNSTKITVTTADASVGATQLYLFRQFVEGNNIADWGWGAAGALTVTLSFWVRSSVTGTFGGALNNNGNTRNYPFTYTINSANTWEYKTIIIPGDTTGTWATDTNRGVAATFSLGVGSSASAAAGAWTGPSGIYSATGATNLIETLNATWYVTGVQLETGSVATPFERRPYGTELNLCYRYYYRNFPNATTKMLSTSGNSSSTTSGTFFGQFPVPMRVAPSALETSGTANQYLIAEPGLTAVTCNAVPTYSAITTETIYVIVATVASGITANRFHVLRTDGTNGAGAYLGWSAEL